MKSLPRECEVLSLDPQDLCAKPGVVAHGCKDSDDEMGNRHKGMPGSSEPR